VEKANPFAYSDKVPHLMKISRYLVRGMVTVPKHTTGKLQQV